MALPFSFGDLFESCYDTSQAALALTRGDVFANLAGRIGISRLANITGLDIVGIPTVSAIRPNGKSLCVSQGKGMSLEQARISAIMEAAELHFAEHCQYLPCFEKNEGNDSVDSSGSLVAEDLCSGELHRVAIESVSMDQRVVCPDTKNCFPATSTGLAAGLDRIPALFHALTEVIERDAHSLWLCLPLQSKLATLVDHQSIDDQSIVSLIKKFNDAGYECCLWDLSSDLGVPVYMAEFYTIGEGLGFYWPYSFGTACDQSSNLAIQKAICEAAQIRLTYITGARDDLAWSEYVKGFEHIATSRRALSEAGLPRRTTIESSQMRSGKVMDVSAILNRMTAVGISKIVSVDLTSKDDLVKVVKVLVPELEDTISQEDTPVSNLGKIRLAKRPLQS